MTLFGLSSADDDLGPVGVVVRLPVVILEELGYHVIEAADGEAGLRIFSLHAEGVDLPLTDVVVPGGELAERVATIRPGGEGAFHVRLHRKLHYK